MLSIFDGLRTLSGWSVLLRMGLGCVLSLLIGLERSAKNRPAGFRTHVLVCVGAITATLTSLYILEILHLSSDVSRIPAQVIAGLGFIGAGTIFVTKKMTVRGLNTAAGLWTTGIIGLGIGCGYYELAILGTALVLIIEVPLGKLSEKIRGRGLTEVEIRYQDKETLDRAIRQYKDRRMTIEKLSVRALEGSEEGGYCAKITLRGMTETEEPADTDQ